MKVEVTVEIPWVGEVSDEFEADTMEEINEMAREWLEEIKEDYDNVEVFDDPCASDSNLISIDIIEE